MWQKAYAESLVLSADAVKLVGLVYGYAVESTQEARRRLAAGDIRGRAHAISRVIAAISELEGSLNYDAGGAVARNMAALYAYSRQRLTEANMRQQDAPLAEVEALLVTLSEAWNKMPTQDAPESSPVEVPRAVPSIWAQPQTELAHSWSA